MHTRTVATAAIIAGWVLILTGCAHNRYTGNKESRHGCDSLGGVFLNIGRNQDSGAPDYSHPRDAPRLSWVMDGPSETAPAIDHRSIDSVAIRHAGSGTIDWAMLDVDGGVVGKGVYEHYVTCSRGVLKKSVSRDPGEGWIGADEKITSTLYVNEDGYLVVNTRSSFAGVFLGFPIVGTDAHWKEFPPDPRYQVADIEF